MKNWYASKTFWFNAITLVVMIVTAISDQSLIDDRTVLGIFAIVVTTANAILRVFFTGMPIKGTSLSRTLSH